MNSLIFVNTITINGMVQSIKILINAYEIAFKERSLNSPLQNNPLTSISYFDQPIIGKIGHIILIKHITKNILRQNLYVNLCNSNGFSIIKYRFRDITINKSTVIIAKNENR